MKTFIPSLLYVMEWNKWSHKVHMVFVIFINRAPTFKEQYAIPQSYTSSMNWEKMIAFYRWKNWTL